MKINTRDECDSRSRTSTSKLLLQDYPVYEDRGKYTEPSQIPVQTKLNDYVDNLKQPAVFFNSCPSDTREYSKNVRT